MTKRKFGNRTATSRIPVNTKEAPPLKAIDYVGVGLLCIILALLPIAGQISEPVTSFINYIYDVLGQPEIVAKVSNDAHNNGMSGLIADMPVRSVLVAAHQASLVLGFGSALFLDLYLMQFLHHRAINQQTIEIAEFGSSLVTIGLALIWISGLCILLYYYLTDPILLQNPKIWSKLIIVYALSVNGHFIHKYVLPNLRNNFGKRVLDSDFISVVKSSLVVASDLDRKLGIRICSWRI